MTMQFETVAYAGSTYTDENTYVGYYACAGNCPTEEQNPGWSIVSKTREPDGSHGACARCVVNKIIFKRIGTVQPKTVKFSASTFMNNGENNYRYGWTIDGVYTNYGTVTVEAISKSYSGSIDKYILEQGVQYGYFKATDTIYGIDGKLFDSNAPTQPNPPSGYVEGSTRTVKCPQTDKWITQRYTGGQWVTIDKDINACTPQDYKNLILYAIIAIIIYMLFLRK